MARLREYTAEVIITVKAKVNVAGHDDDEAYEEAMQKAMDLQDSITSSGLNRYICLLPKEYVTVGLIFPFLIQLVIVPVLT